MPRSFLLPWAILFAVLLAGAAPAASPEWLRLEADGFTFMGNVGERRLKTIANDLRLFRYAISGYITTSPSGDAMPVLVLAVSQDTWDRYLRPREGLAGFFMPSAFEGDILVEAEHGWETSRMIVYHEYTHHYIHNLDKFPYPPWFDEGIAQFLSTTTQQGRKIYLGRMPYGNWLKTGPDDWLPMSRLVRVNLNSPEYVNHDGAAQFYPQTWLFMHYLLVGNQQKRDGLNPFLAGMVNGEDASATVRAAFGMSFEELDAELKSYYKRQDFRVLTLPAPAAVEKITTGVMPVDDQDAWRQVGLAALRSRPQDTSRIVPIFEKLLRDAPGDTTSMAGLALALRAAGKEQDAEPWMATVAKAADADTMALRLCGDFYLGQALESPDLDTKSSRYGLAHKCYERAMTANPADYYALIGFAQSDTDPSADTVQKLIGLLEKATRQYPQSEYLGLALAKAYFDAGDRARSVITLRRAVITTRDPDMRRQLAAQLRLLAN